MTTEDARLRERRRIGMNIRVARVRANLSQSLLGKKLGKSQQSVHNWEQGINSPTPGDLLKIGRILGVDPAWILTAGTSVDDPDKPSPLLEEQRERLAVAALVEQIRQLPPSKRELLGQFLHALIHDQ